MSSAVTARRYFSMLRRRRCRRIGLLRILLATGLSVGMPDPAVALGPDCEATVLNRTVRISKDGTFALPNVPIPPGPFRARVLCEFEGEIIHGEDREFKLRTGSMSEYGHYVKLGSLENAAVEGTEGVMRSLMSADVLRVSGVEEVDGQPVDDACEYVAEWQILTVWPIDEAGKIIGEDTYFGSPPMQSVGKRAG